MSQQIEAISLLEASKQALEALEYIDDGANNQGAHTGVSWRCVSNKAQPAITSIRQAIAEAEKANERSEVEPVAWGVHDQLALNKMLAEHPQSKREWVGLTDEEIATASDYFEDVYGFTQGVLWAEAKLKEKNTIIRNYPEKDN